MHAPGTFSGKTALVTGGGTGLGLEISKRLGRLGARIACASRDVTHHAALLEDGERMGYEVLSLAVDVREAKAVRACVASVVERFGGLEILINNAAGNFIRPSLKLAPKAWQAVIDIALSGVFYCSQAAGRVMVEHGEGVIINISAPYAATGMPGVVHSACAKAGVDAMTKTLAAEWGRSGVRVNAISPGPFHSRGAQVRLWPTEELETRMRDSVPLGRFGETEEIADAVVWLASPDAKYCNGTILTMDGGWLLGGGGMDVDIVRRRRDGN